MSSVMRRACRAVRLSSADLTLSVGWDPKATAKNLLDARWVYYFDEFDLKDALDLFDKSKAR